MVDLRAPRLSARQGAAEQEIAPRPQDNGAIELGTVGWQDGASHVDDGTGSNDGNTLVKVQLFRDRDPRLEQTPDRGQGSQILARCSATHVPTDGAQVLVARPAGFDGPGVWTIISILGPGAGPILPADGGTFIRQGRDGTISLGTTTDGTKDGTLAYLQVRRDGLRYVAPWGKISFDQGGLHVLHFSGARLDLGGIGGVPSPLDQLSTYATLSAAILQIQGSAIAMGTSAGAPDPVALSTAVLASFTAIATWAGTVDFAIKAIGTGLSTLGYLGAAAAITAETTGLGVMNAALTAQAALTPSQSTGST